METIARPSALIIKGLLKNAQAIAEEYFQSELNKFIDETRPVATAKGLAVINERLSLFIKNDFYSSLEEPQIILRLNKDEIEAKDNA